MILLALIVILYGLRVCPYEGLVSLTCVISLLIAHACIEKRARVINIALFLMVLFESIANLSSSVKVTSRIIPSFFSELI